MDRYCESIIQTTNREVTLGMCTKQKHRATNRLRLFVLFLLICALCWQPDRAFSLSAGSKPAEAARDGAHDFDFSTGVWHTHIRRVLDPFSPSSDVVELSGTVTTRPIWGGRARLEEIEADGPKGHWEGLSLFLYNPQSHQWSQSFLNSKSAVLTGSLVGEFHDGRGELYQHDTYHDKSIFVRAVWSEITPNSHRYTESFSNDGGKTWVTSFDAHKTREKDLPPSDMAAGAEPMEYRPASGFSHGGAVLLESFLGLRGTVFGRRAERLRRIHPGGAGGLRSRGFGCPACAG